MSEKERESRSKAWGRHMGTRFPRLTVLLDRVTEVVRWGFWIAVVILGLLMANHIPAVWRELKAQHTIAEVCMEAQPPSDTITEYVSTYLRCWKFARRR